MPVSPADFEFYSRMTGQPIPNTPAGRMAIAPQVYNMRRGGGGFGRFLRGAAKGALAAGALAGAGALALATQEEMAKKPSAPKTETAKDQNIDLDSSAFTEPVESVRDKAEAFAAYTAGNVYNPQFSVGAPAKEKRARVTENLTDTGMSTETTPGGQKLTVSATDSPARMAGSPQILSGDALSAAEAEVFDDPRVLIGEPLQNRISGQTQVPQADPNTAFESRGAQIASTSEPTQPRVEVRQQPSSGVQVTDLSNVAATETGRPQQTAPGVDTEVGIAQEFYEASPGQSPFQAEGAMGELARQSREVKQSVGDLPGSIRGDVAIYLSNLGNEEKGRMAGSAFRTPIPGSSSIGSVELNPQNPEYIGVSYAKTPGKTYSQAVTPTFGRALMSQMDRLSDPEQSKLEQSEMESMGKMVSDMKKLGSIVPEGQSAPELFTTPQVRSSFVTDGGKKVEGVMNQVASRKRQQRESELRDVMRKGGARLSPEKQEEAIQKMLTDEGL